MMAELFSLRGRVAVVTGGLGLLGRQFARGLAEAGARVAILDLPCTPERIAAAYGAEADAAHFLFLTADVTRRASLEEALAAIRQHWETPHILVNNAALDSPPHSPPEENGPFETYPEASWDKVLEVNLKGVFLCSQVFGGAMAEAGRGSIINISSIYGLVSPDQSLYTYRQEKEGAPFFKPVAYSASKSGLLNLTRYLATYWAGRGVRVNTLTLAGVFNRQDERFLAGYTRKVPLGRMAREDEYRGAVVFLSGEASSYMTGSNLIMDGGWTAW